MLQRLPAELRLPIYDYLLQTLLEMPEHHDSYVLPDEWPCKSFAAYHGLLLTCKIVKEELEPHFEEHFAPCITLFSEDAGALLTFARRACASPKAKLLSDIPISLRSPIRSFVDGYIEQSNDSAPDLVVDPLQGFIDDLSLIIECGAPSERGAPNDLHMTLVRVVVDTWRGAESLARNGRVIKLGRAAVDTNHRLYATVRRIQGDAFVFSTYVELTAKVKDFAFEGSLGTDDNSIQLSQYRWKREPNHEELDRVTGKLRATLDSGQQGHGEISFDDLISFSDDDEISLDDDIATNDEIPTSFKTVRTVWEQSYGGYRHGDSTIPAITTDYENFDRRR